MRARSSPPRRPDLACGRYVDPVLRRSIFGSRQRLRRTRRSRPAPPNSVKVTEIEIAGDTATAEGVPDRRALGRRDDRRSKLVREGGIWKVDSLRSNAPVGP